MQRCEIAFINMLLLCRYLLCGLVCFVFRRGYSLKKFSILSSAELFITALFLYQFPYAIDSRYRLVDGLECCYLSLRVQYGSALDWHAASQQLRHSGFSACGRCAYRVCVCCGDVLVSSGFLSCLYGMSRHWIRKHWPGGEAVHHSSRVPNALRLFPHPGYLLRHAEKRRVEKEQRAMLRTFAHEHAHRGSTGSMADVLMPLDASVSHRLESAAELTVSPLFRTPHSPPSPTSPQKNSSTRIGIERNTSM